MRTPWLAQCAEATAFPLDDEPHDGCLVSLPRRRLAVVLPSGSSRRRSASAAERAGAEVGAAVAALQMLDIERAPAAALAALVMGCAATALRVAMQLAGAAVEAPAPAGPERFISVAAAAERLARSPKWLYRRKHLPFLRQLAPGTWAVSLPALERWMAARPRRSR